MRALGRRAATFEADLADPGQARAMVARVVEEMGPVHGLVNNAGIMPQSPFLEISDAEWAEVLDTDLTAAPSPAARPCSPGCSSWAPGRS